MLNFYDVFAIVSKHIKDTPNISRIVVDEKDNYIVMSVSYYEFSETYSSRFAIDTNLTLEECDYHIERFLSGLQNITLE